MEQQMKIIADAVNEIMRQTLAGRDEIERLREDAKRDAKYMLALHRIRQWKGKEFMEAFDQAVKLYEDEQPAKATGKPTAEGE